MIDPRLPFATRSPSQSALKVYASKFISTYQILLPPDCSCCRDKVNRVARRRSSALFFARHLDYFAMTQNLTSITRTWYRQDNFIVTSECSSTYRDWQKTRHLDILRYRSGQAHGNSLNRRAVMGNCADQVTVNLDNFVIIDSSLLPRQFRYQRN